MGDNINLEAGEAAVGGAYESASLKSFLPAFLKVKLSLQAAKRNAVNPQLRNRYADLSEVLETVEPPALAEGLVPIARVIQAEGMFGVDYRLYHAESQEFYGTRVMFPVMGNATAQDLGGLRTYAHRYAAATLFSVRLDDDDDGNAASGVTGPREARKGVAPDAGRPAGPASEKQKALIERLAKQAGVEVPDEVLADSKKASAFIDGLKDTKPPVTVVDVAQETPTSEPATPASSEEESPLFTTLKGRWSGKPPSEEEAASRRGYLEKLVLSKRMTREEADRLQPLCVPTQE